MASYEILIADDHPLFRSALHQALTLGLGPDVRLVEAASIAELEARLNEKADWDLVLLDLNMPGAYGFSGLVLLRGQYPQVPVVMISAQEEAAVVQRSREFGASGFIPKSSPLETLQQAVRAVLDGDTWWPPQDAAAEALSEEAKAASAGLASLTPQQFRVLTMVCEGLLNKQIAYDLNVSEATVKAHVTAIFRKLNVRTRTQAALLLDWQGWQSIFVCLTLFAALAGLGVALWLPETIPADGERPPLSGALGQYRRLFADRLFLAYGLSGGVAMAGMFAYIAGSPYVFIQLYGIPAEHYGWLFGSNAAGFIVMAQVNARLLRYRGPAFWLRRIIWGYLVCGLALLGIASLQPATLWPLLVPLFGCVASLGCIIPNASACAMAGQGQHAGSASALMGSLQFSVAAGASALVGVLHDGTAIPMTLVIAVCGAVATLLAWQTGRLERQAA